MNYTKYAKQLLQTIEHDNIIHISENIGFDGCDNEGPKAMIYTLFIIYKNNDNPTKQYNYSIYTAEQYYTQKTVEYTLLTTLESNNYKKINNWNDLHEMLEINEIQ
jgi:hypothetical protein